MLEVVYEDNHVIVVVKPSGILSQADHTGDNDLLSMVKEYVKIKYNKPGEAYIGLVHRLDRNTSGLMVFARTSKAASRLSDCIRTHDFTKEYLAYVVGIFTSKQGTMTDYLIKNEEEVKSYVTSKEKGKLAVLDYEVLKESNNNSIIKVTLHTGRHHQIRVQMANDHHPLVGDNLYCDKSNESFKLHAYHLSFVHPTTKEVMDFYNYPSWYKE